MSGFGSSTAPGAESGKVLLDELLAAFMTKDLSKMMSIFADDAVVYDPHYPQPRMVGKDAIQQGLEWSLTTLEKPGLTVRHLWLDDQSGVAEIDTHHLIRGGIEAKFDQVYVFEFRDSKITRFQAYVPYRPHGIAGLMGQTTGFIWRLQGKLK